MIRIPLPTKGECNTNNHYEYTPYIIDDDKKIIIDDTWFDSLTTFIQILICKSVKNFVLAKVIIPHIPQYDKELLNVYQSYLDGFDYHIWYSPIICTPNVKFIDINDYCKQLLIDKMPLPSSFISKIANAMEPEQKYFVRLSSTSGKNEIPVKPYSNVIDVLNFLNKCNIFIGREYKRKKTTKLILIPWNSTINARNEFRIFVCNGKLTAASPQYYWQIQNYTEEELDEFQKILNSKISFISIYHSFIADVYLENGHCHLIELNPFGAHSGAGSSLFHWIDDYDLLHGNLEHAEMRYLSIIKI